MAPRRNAHSVPAEVSLVHLQSCLVNLPASLVSILVNINTVSPNPSQACSHSQPDRSSQATHAARPECRRRARIQADALVP